MNSQELQKMRDKVAEEKQNEGKLKQEGQEAKQQAPSSSSSSPAHEFSFTISLHPPSTTIPDKAKPPSSFAIDLSPADDIFFHGHLLPLHLLSHLPVSPRSSINSSESFTLPIGDLKQNQNLNKSSANNDHRTNDHGEIKGRTKSNSFSLFGLSKWRKGCEVKEKEEKEEKERNKRKLSFDVSQVLKRYMRMVRPLLSFRGRRGNLQYQRQAYSYSGNLSLRRKQDVRGRRGEYSAPASMRTSPNNSGLLVATGAVPTNTSDSTMEELQAAIQAAIAHCKKSIAKEDKIKCQD